MKRFTVERANGEVCGNFDTREAANTYARSCFPMFLRIVDRGCNPHEIADRKAAELSARAEKSGGMKRFVVEGANGELWGLFHTREDAEYYKSTYAPPHTHVREFDSDRGTPVETADTKASELAARAVKSPNLLCFIEQFPLAIAAVANVHDYERGPLGKGDYRPSLMRHLFGIGEHADHDAAVVWNALAQLEVKLRLERERGAP